MAYYWAGLTQQEIAEQMGIGVRTAENMIANAKKLLAR